ncbi:MAG TPA: virulence factor [Anaerolineales bacterium]|nr:virulence factor [Anaerolineales bacterium]
MSAQMQIVYWRDIPAQVKTRSGETRASQPLSDRFQQAIDQAAMVAGMAGSDDYLGAWRTSAWERMDGTATEAAEATSARLEGEYPDTRLRRLAAGGGLES